MPSQSPSTGGLVPSTFTGYLKMELQRRGVTVVTVPIGAYKFPQVTIDFEGFRPVQLNQRGPRMPVCLLTVFSGVVTAEGEYPYHKEELEASMTFIWDKLQDMVHDPRCPVSMFNPVEPRGNLIAQRDDAEIGLSEFNAQQIEVGSGEFFAQQGYFYNSNVDTPDNSDGMLFDIDNYDYENDPLDLFDDDKFEPFDGPVDRRTGNDVRRFLPRVSP